MHPLLEAALIQSREDCPGYDVDLQRLMAVIASLKIHEENTLEPELRPYSDIDQLHADAILLARQSVTALNKRLKEGAPCPLPPAT